MNYVVNGKPIPEKFTNAAGPTKTSDIGAVISPTVINRIIEKIEATGMILPLVTRTAFAAGGSHPYIFREASGYMGGRRWRI